MRNLSPRRRAAAVCAACAAIIPSASLLMHNSHSDSLDFAGGLVIGVAIAISIALTLRGRRACS